MRWLVAAHEKEIPGFFEFSRNGWQAHALGIGQFNALAGLAGLAASGTPEAILLAGTAGCLDTAAQGKIFLAQHFLFPAIDGEEVPEFLETQFATEPAMADSAFEHATVLQNYGVSLNAEKFARNASRIPADFPKPVLENMEAAGLAAFCRQRSIPFTAMLVVTNQIGPNARTEWKSHFKQAGQQLAGALTLLC